MTETQKAHCADCWKWHPECAQSRLQKLLEWLDMPLATDDFGHAIARSQVRGILAGTHGPSKKEKTEPQTMKFPVPSRTLKRSGDIEDLSHTVKFDDGWDD